MIIINQFHREFSENPLRRKLKELRNYNHKLLIVSATKIGGNTTNIINCYFFQAYLPFGTPNLLSTWRETSLILIISIRSVFLLLKCKESYRPNILQVFYFKRNDSKTFKNSNCKKLFLQCVLYGYNLLR